MTSPIQTASRIPFSAPKFAPPFWLTNPHLQTMLPKFVAPEVPPYRRELVLDALNESPIAYDFFDADADADIKTKLTTNASAALVQTPIVVLFHGLEGGSQSHYARSTAHYVHQQDWHYVVAHLRGCGGVPIQGELFYEAGDTLEVHHTLQHLAKTYQTVYAIGTSLGGSMLAKYLGEYGDTAVCTAASIVSAPLDLASSTIAMQRFFGRKVYTPYLLNPLVKKALQQQLTQDEIAAIKASKSISDFDQAFTARRHGYRSKNDYYHQASALPYLHKISKPTLIITAQDDPFLGVTPVQEDVSDSVVLCTPKHGGHIGFLRWQNKQFDATWLAQTSLQFFKSI